jgi:hypothetical protein
VERKIGSAGKKCALSLSKVRAALKKQTVGRNEKSYRELGVEHPSSSQHCSKVFEKDGIPF